MPADHELAKSVAVILETLDDTLAGIFPNNSINSKKVREIYKLVFEYLSAKYGIVENIETFEIYYKKELLEKFQNDLNDFRDNKQEDFKIFLARMIKFAEVYKINGVEVNFIKEILNTFLSDTRDNFINSLNLISLRNSITNEADKYKNFLAFILKEGSYKDGYEFINNYNDLSSLLENYQKTERDADIIKIAGYKYDKASSLSAEELNKILAFYDDDEIKNEFENHKNMSFKTIKDRLLTGIANFEPKSKFNGTGNPLSYKAEEAIEIIESQDKNFCSYIGSEDDLFRWKCNRMDCFIGFNTKSLEQALSENELTFEKINSELDNEEFKKLTSKFEGNRDNVGTILENLKKNTELGDFLELILENDLRVAKADLQKSEDTAKDHAVGWYYEDSKKILSEFAIVGTYAEFTNDNKTPTNHVKDSKVDRAKTFFNGHHLIGSHWAEQVLNNLFFDADRNPISFYNEDEAVVITLRDTYRESPHQYITSQQKGRKSKQEENTYSKERELARKELQDIVVKSSDYETLGPEDEALLKLLRIQELNQIEKGLKKADNFFKELKNKILAYADEIKYYHDEGGNLIEADKQEDKLTDIKNILDRIIDIPGGELK